MYNIKTRNKLCPLMVFMVTFIKKIVGLIPGWVKTKDYQIGIGCFSATQATLISKSNDWLGWNQNNVFQVK